MPVMADGGPEGIALDQTGDDPHAIFIAQLVHAFKMHENA
jgi:hypothetical protein